ncbi:hypothetical protein NQ317_013348 [Molorchus minor]|uniref:Uncharacterized protein n=1 Tax=Molorchus minor TaxID=1323400 RepID=A0ABQ9ITG3_9CUCU|nr:hypothetical protein NQ317_013348 [Molorchus minor]
MNPILLQKQLRDNATDLQEYYKDLKEWGSPWDEKKQRRENPMKLVPNNKVRKIDKPRKKSINKEIVKKASATKIGVTDYAAWEKFDADAECEKLENDVYDDSELSDELSEKQDQALIEKEKGNKFVHQQKWDEAIKCYTKAIECYSFDPIFLC